MPLTDQTRDEINEAIFAGHKVKAVKLYREATGEGLLESKQFVEVLTERLRKEYPDRVPVQAAGCGTTVVLLATTTGTMLCYLLS